MSQIGITLLFLSIAALLLLGNILRADIVALVLMLALGLNGILTPQAAFSGFSRSAVVIMFSAFVLAEGLRRSGMTERMGLFIIKIFGAGERRLIFGVRTASAVLSLFMNNIAAAALLLPSLSGVARRMNISPSKLLMPLAFGTILGGMATLLTTTNIVVSGLLRDVKLQGFTLTDFAPIGLPLAFAGILFMVFWGRTLLPAQSPAQRHESETESDDLLNTYQIAERLVRAKVFSGGSLDGVTLEKSGLREKYQLNVIAIQRGRSILPIEARTVLKGNDMLPVGVALNKTGASTMFANAILSNLSGAGYLVLLAGFVLLTVALTQVINGAAAVTVIVPIAIVTAQRVGMEPRSVAMAVALASSMAFISPLGHSVNVMVMGAGGYTFKDYARVGIPLTILLVIILMIALPLIMPIG